MHVTSPMVKAGRTHRETSFTVRFYTVCRKTQLGKTEKADITEASVISAFLSAYGKQIPRVGIRRGTGHVHGLFGDGMGEGQMI